MSDMCGIFNFSTRPLRFGINLGNSSNASPGSGPSLAAAGATAHDNNHNMQQKSDNNKDAAMPSSQGHHQRPTHLPLATVNCDYDSDSSDGPILYRDDDEPVSEEGLSPFLFLI